MNNNLGKIHFPTALGLIILLAAVFLGIFMVKTRLGPAGGDQPLATPRQVRITNVSADSFSVSWVTDTPVSGLVRFGETAADTKQTATDDRDQLSGEKGEFTVHHATVKNLKASTAYFFTIESAGKKFDNNGKPFTVTAGPALANPPAADSIYGTVLTSGGLPAEGAVVYVNIANAAPLSALTKSGGSWALSLSMARRTDLSAFIQYDTQVAIINLLVQAGSQGTASVITSTNNDSPVPDITLGKSQDFRPLAAAAPAATDSGKKSGFGLEPLVAQVATDSGEVTLDNPSFDGEIINATQPAFIGSGPPGTVLAIEVHSTNPLTGSAKIDEQGNWEYTLTKGLDPGQHEVTISYMDADKKEQVIKRNFVIAAPGDTDIPAITATQAASTDTGRTRMPSTSAGVPHPGSGEVSLLMLLTGLGLLIGGLKIKNVV